MAANRQMTETGKRLDKVLEKIEEERKELQKEKAVVEELVENAGEHCRETRRILSRVEVKENMICSYAEIVRESENLTGLQYKRAFYASTLCKELTKSALGTMDGALTLLKRVRNMKVSIAENGNGDGNENLNEVTVVHTDNWKEESDDEGKALDSIISELLETVRFLRIDVSDMKRSAKVLEDVGFLDDNLRIKSGEFADCSSLCIDRTEPEQKRSRARNLVRIAMPYEDSRYGSKSEYEHSVILETSRQMKLSDRNRSSLLTGVVQTLKDSTVDSGGAVLKKFRQVFDGESGPGPSCP